MTVISFFWLFYSVKQRLTIPNYVISVGCVREFSVNTPMVGTHCFPKTCEGERHPRDEEKEIQVEEGIQEYFIAAL